MRRLVAICCFLLPLSAHAEALSPWVEGVLQRTEMGVLVAASRPSGPCTNETILHEMWQARDTVATAAASFIETGVEASLRERTVCFESDRRLLIEKMARVLSAMDDAVRSCNTDGLRVLLSTFDFINAAYLSFLEGGIDPSYRDDRLRRQYLFESDWNWTQRPLPDGTLDDTSTAPLCAFTTDYVPHALAYSSVTSDGSPTDIRSYGCDATVLSTLPAEWSAEADPEKALMDRLDLVARSLATSVQSALLRIDAIVMRLTGREPSAGIAAPKPLPPHEEKTGCLRPIAPLDSPGPYSLRLEAERQAFPGAFDPAYPWTNYFGSMPSFDTPLEELLPVQLPLRSLRKDALADAVAFLSTKERFGLLRPLPGLFYDQQEAGAASYYQRLGVDIPDLSEASGESDRTTAHLEALSRDALERAKSASAPLRDAVESLTDVSENFLTTEYVPSVAFFLARSCVDGPCQKKLLTILQRIHNPYCTPYVSGLYGEEQVPQKCFCDPSIEAEDPGFYDTYCRETLTASEIEAYRNRPDEQELTCHLDGTD